MKLNKEQIGAISTTSGKLCVYAGPGSGKTTILANRYQEILKSSGCTAKDILCVTFARKAAKEMKKRIDTQCDVSSNCVTMHSFCRKFIFSEIEREEAPQIVRGELYWDQMPTEPKKSKYSIFQNMKLMTPKAQKEITQKIINEKQLKIDVKTFISNLSIYKKNNFPTYIEKYFLSDNKRTETNDCFAIFIEEQRKNNLITFDDFIYLTYYILLTSESARDHWQNQYKFIMVDESQDMSDTSKKILKILAEKNGNLFEVGDNDQILYQWRGVNPNNTDKTYFDKKIDLSQNYRSTKNILKAANAIKPKTYENQMLFTENEEGEKVSYYHAKDKNDEAEWVLNEIKKILATDENTKPENIAILYREERQSKAVKDFLIKNGFRYTGLFQGEFLERKDIKFLLSTLKIIAMKTKNNRKYKTNWENEWYLFQNIITREFLPLMEYTDSIKVKNEFENSTANLLSILSNANISNPEMKNNLNNWIKMISECRWHLKGKKQWNLTELINYIIEETKLQDEIRADQKQESLRAMNLNLLRQTIHDFEIYQKENFPQSKHTIIEQFFKYLELNDTNRLQSEKDKADMVEKFRIMSIHASKGLEFKYVFIIGMNRGIMPSIMPEFESGCQGNEEERRIAYVAVTRAMKKLFLSESSKMRCPSIYIQNIIDQAPDCIDVCEWWTNYQE